MFQCTQIIFNHSAWRFSNNKLDFSGTVIVYFCPIPGGVQGLDEWGLGQLDLVPNLVVSEPVHSRGIGIR